jgi:DNA-directed RNA polymerase specialized sigma subunit
MGYSMTEYQKEQQIIEWLQDYEALKAGAENLKQAIEDIAEEGMGINYDKDPSGPTNKFHSVVENAALKVDRLNIQHRIKVMSNIVNNIDKALLSLNDIERAVITNRCMSGLYYYQFCYQIGASERTAKRIKKEALRKMSIVIFGKE